MRAFPVLIDSSPAYFDGAAVSLLRMPLGSGTVLSHLCERISADWVQPPTILTTFEPDGGYVAECERTAANLEAVRPAAQFDELLHEHEPSDWLLLVDPSQFPTGGMRVADVFRAARDRRKVTHWVSVERSSEPAQERVLLNDAGAIRRIQRYYAGITWINTCTVSFSMMSVAAARQAVDGPFTCLADLRQALAACGIPGRDTLLRGGAIDLNEPEGLLRLNEQNLIAAAAARAERNGNGAAALVRRGVGCRIDRGARLYGAVQVQDGVTIEDQAVVIGPALLGAGAHVGGGAVLAQCVVAAGVRIPAGTTLRHRVLLPAPGGNGARRERFGHAPAPASRGHLSMATDRSTERSGGGSRRWYPQVKLCIESPLALAGLLVFSPILLVAALLVKLTSAGPVLFGHRRETRGGRVFRCWKFRTMVADADAQQRKLYRENQVDGPQFKLGHDPRITAVGRWLRKTNIDELPQLINVVLGQMSLIGPRPSPFRENQICVPWREARLSVRPGITGLWQVCRSDRSDGDFHQWIHYDMLYVRHMSPLLDLKILVATLLTLGGRWSVPVEWLIPAHKLRALDVPRLPTRAPVLGSASAGALAGQVGAAT